jgi:3D (Asp-Asp-Asp) domain-containing protein
LCGVIVLVSLVSDYRSLSTAGETPLHNNASSSAAFARTDLPYYGNDPVTYEQAPVYRVYRVTAYCDRGLTAAGTRSGIGQCAAPANIPFGTRIHIPALDRTFIVTDRTAKRFRHNTVDLFIPSRADCRDFGCQYLECEITLPTSSVRYGSRRLHAALEAVRERA